MSARKMTAAEREEFIEHLCLADPMFEEHYRKLCNTAGGAVIETVTQWLIQSAHARQRRAQARRRVSL